MMRLSVGPSNIPAGQVLNPSQVPHLHQYGSACGFWFWQGPLPAVPVFGQQPGAWIWKACWRIYVWTCGREDAWPREEGQRHLLQCLFLAHGNGAMSSWCLVFQMSSSNGGRSGSVCVRPGLVTWGSACCPANGRACVQMGFAVVQTVSTAQL